MQHSWFIDTPFEVKLPRTDFYSLYKEVRNGARRYNPESIVRMAMRELYEPVPNKLEDLRRAPWQILLLVKWICQDDAQDPRAPDITFDAFYTLRQAIWSMPERLVSGIGDTLPGYLFFRQLLHAQAAMQRRFSTGFVREAAILLQQDRNHPLRKMFNEKTGLRLNDFVDLAFALYCGLLEGKRTFSADWFRPLTAHYSAKTINTFASVVSRTVPELTGFCRALPDAHRKLASELFQFPVLARYPFLRTGTVIECWHPAVFYRGMESLVHNVLSEAGQDYMGGFSKIFERHVLDEAKRVPAQVFTEEAIKSWLPAQSKVPDGLLSYPTCNVFVESKAGMFDDSVMTVGHTGIFADRTRAIQDAIGQGWAASTGLRQRGSAPETVRNAPKDYLLIVTNRELSAGRGTALQLMYPPETLIPPDTMAAIHLPVDHIYVLSIEDFERFAASAAQGEIDVPAFLADCVANDSESASSVFYFEQHLDRARTPRRVSELVHQAVGDSVRRLEKALGRELPIT